MKLRILLLTMVLLVCLNGCKVESPQHTEPTEPTLPTFDNTTTPKEQLQSAIDKLKGKKITVSYGMGLDEPQPTTTQDLAVLQELVSNEDFLEDFCNLGLMAIPSNKGTFCYQVTNLTPEQICQLLCDRSLTAEEQQKLSNYPDAMGTVGIYVDAEGVFQSLKVDVPLTDSNWMLIINITR